MVYRWSSPSDLDALELAGPAYRVKSGALAFVLRDLVLKIWRETTPTAS